MIKHILTKNNFNHVKMPEQSVFSEHTLKNGLSNILVYKTRSSYNNTVYGVNAHMYHTHLTTLINIL